MVSVQTRKRKVLILEEESSIRNVLYLLLSNLGCNTDVALDARQALAEVKRDSFDSVLLDLRCSEIPGPELVSQLNSIRPNLVGRVLVITGEATDASVIRALEAQHVHHFPQSQIFGGFVDRLSVVFDAPTPATLPGA